MTSGDDWHPGPHSQWIRAGLGNRSRYWLEGELSNRLGKNRKAVERAINRWTSKDGPGSEPKGAYLDALTALFGEPPSRAETKTYRDHESRIMALEDYQAKIKQLAAATPEELLQDNQELRELLHRLSGP